MCKASSGGEAVSLIRGDNPGRQGGQCRIIPPLRKSEHRGGDGREGMYMEL